MESIVTGGVGAAGPTIVSSILDSLAGSVAIVNSDGVIVEVNEGWRNFARANNGDPATEMGIGLDYLGVCGAADPRNAGAETRDAEAGIRHVLAGKAHEFELEYPCHSPAELRWFSLSVTRLKPPAAGAVIQHRNITDRKIAERKLALSESRLSAILDSALVGAMTLNGRREITSFNKEAAEIFGYRPDEVIGRSLDMLIPAVQRGTHNRMVDEFERSGLAQKAMSDWRRVSGVRKDGVQIPLMVGISKLMLDGEVTMTAVFRDMTDIRDAELRLRALVDEKEALFRKAEAASEMKSWFLATMSHELRTPLNAIIGFSSMIENELLGAGTTKKYLEYARLIRSSGTHLSSVVSDLLDLTKIEARKVDLAIEPLDFFAAARAACASLAALALEKGIDIENYQNDTDCKVRGDARAVQQILMNVVGNAIKFTDRGGRVSIRLERHASGTHGAIAVSDTGIGIPPDKISKIGTAFYQVNPSALGAHRGTGLGLAICKSLADSMDGGIAIESEFGKGTTVRLFLPLA